MWQNTVDCKKHEPIIFSDFYIVANKFLICLWIILGISGREQLKERGPICSEYLNINDKVVHVGSKVIFTGST